MAVEDEARAEVAQQIGVITTDENIETAIRNYGLLPDNAVPIPKGIGKKFETRFNDGIKALREGVHVDWKASLDEYLKTGTFDDSIENGGPQENIVRTTVETLVDHTYMRNPAPEFSTVAPEAQQLAKVLTTALTNLVNRRSEVNLRPRVVKQMIMSHLTNAGCLFLDHQPREGSRQAVATLYEQLQKSMLALDKDDTETLDRFYEMLDQVYEMLSNRKDFGMSVEYRSPFGIILDPECTDVMGLSDAQWLMDIDVIKTDEIKAKYLLKDEETKKYKYRYDESKFFDQDDYTKVDGKDRETTEQEILDKIMPERDEHMAKLIAADSTVCVWVYDKATRLKYLYVEGKWETPLWVYNDTLQLSRFFQHFFLPFTTAVTHALQPGVVSQYIGFQKEINDIYYQESLIRDAAFSLIVYNSQAIDKEEVDKVINEAYTRRTRRGLRAIGVKLRDQDKNLQDVMEPFRFPVTQFSEVFNKDGLRKAVATTSRISEAMKGSEYKTHTTDDAVEAYAQAEQMRIEGVTDRIEDATEELFWSMAEILVSKFDLADIQRLTSPKMAEDFEQMTVQEFNERFTLTIAAGSMEKPTSRNKKKEATTIMQLLGQIGSAAPVTTLQIMFRMLRETFSRTLVTDEDVETLKKEGAANMQKGVSTEQAQPGQTENPNGG